MQANELILFPGRRDRNLSRQMITDDIFSDFLSALKNAPPENKAIIFNEFFRTHQFKKHHPIMVGKIICTTREKLKRTAASIMGGCHCPSCPKKFKNIPSLWHHLKTIHKRKTTQASSKKSSPSSPLPNASTSPSSSSPSTPETTPCETHKLPPLPFPEVSKDHEAQHFHSS